MTTPIHLFLHKGLVHCLGRQGRFVEAELLCRPLYIVAQKILGAEHPRTFTSMSVLASLLHIQGKLQEAEDMFRDTLRRMQKTFGVDQLQANKRWAMPRFCEYLEIQGKHEEAKAMYRTAYRLHGDVFGLEHENTLWVKDQLASCLGAQARSLR